MEILNKLTAPQRKPVRAKIVRNVLFSAGRALLVWPIPFLLIPFIVGKLGTRGYGAWAVCLTVINLTALADLGLCGTLTKHVSESDARQDFPALERLLDAGLMLYVLLATLVVAVLWAGSGLVLRALFGVSPAAGAELLTAWHRVAIVGGINILNLTFYSVLTGMQRMDLSNGLLLVNTVLSAGLSVLFLTLHWGLVGLADAYLAAALLNVLLQARLALHLLPHVRMNPLASDWRQMRYLFGFSLKMYTMQMASLIQDQIEKLYLAWFVGIVPVGWYNMAGEAAVKIRRIPELLLAPMAGAAAELHAQGDQMRLRELYYRAHKYLAVAAVPLAFFVAAASKRLTALWLGRGLEVVALPMVVLLGVNLMNLFTYPGFYVLLGQGVLEPTVFASTAAVALNVVLSLGLIYRWGFQGAFVGTFLSALLSMGLFTSLFHRHTGYGYSRLAGEAYLKPLVCAGGLILLIRYSIAVGRLGWGGLVLVAAGFGAAYLVALLLARFFDEFDLVQLERYVPLARLVRKVVPLAPQRLLK